MKIKRLIAYVLDMLLITILTSFIFTTFFKNDYEEYSKLSESFLASYQEILTSDNINTKELEAQEYKLYKSQTSMQIIECALIFAYFGIISYLLHGQTLNQKIFKLKVVSTKDESPSPGLFILRSIIKSNLIFKLVQLLGLLFLNENMALNTIIATTYLSYIFYLIIILVMIFRTDGRGLHDIICATKVIDVKKD